MEKVKWNRRDFLRLSAAAATGAIAAACAPATPLIVEKEVVREVPVEKAVVVEKEVVKEVPVEKVVEKEVIKEVPVEKVVKETVVLEKEVEKVITAVPEPVKMSVVIAQTPEALEENFRPFEEKHPDYDVQVIGTSWDEYDDKVAFLIAGGTPPTVWYPAGKRSVFYYVRRQEQEGILPLVPALGPYLDRDDYDWSDFFRIDPDGQSYGGKRYGIPVALFPTPLAYNKDLFDQAGVPYPPDNWEDESWTWDEFISRAQALTQHAEDPMNTVWGFGGGISYRYGHLHFGVDLWERMDYDTQSPETSLVTSEPFKWQLQMQRDLIWKHKLQPTPDVAASFQAVAQQSAFFSGKAAMAGE